MKFALLKILEIFVKEFLLIDNFFMISNSEKHYTRSNLFGKYQLTVCHKSLLFCKKELNFILRVPKGHR